MTVDLLDSGNAPEIFASGLERVEVMGPVCRFVLYVVRNTPTGTVKEIIANIIVPTDAVPPAIALTLKSLPAASLIPAIGQVTKQLLM